MTTTSVAPSSRGASLSCYQPSVVGHMSFLSSIKHKVLCQPARTANNAHQLQHQQTQARSDFVDPAMGNKSSRQSTRRLSTSTRSTRSTSQAMGTPKTYAPKSGGDVPPPAYTPAPNGAVIPAVPSVNSAVDDPYDFLTSFDTVFLIDDSGSMAGRSWRETKDALETIIPVCVQHDADGIDLYFLNARDSSYHHNITSPATVREIFSSVAPRGSTPTGQRLNAILKPYLQRCEQNLDGTKPLNLIVITDGVPTDDVESTLILAAKKLDRLEAPAWQVGVQFFQVGNDPSAKTHLKQLDDELSELAGGEVRDMVDTVPFKSSDGGSLTGEGILKVVLGAVNRRLDRKKSKELHR